MEQAGCIGRRSDSGVTWAIGRCLERSNLRILPNYYSPNEKWFRPC